MILKTTSAAQHGISCSTLAPLDPLNADVKTLQQYLREGKETSISLVDIYLKVIETQDHYLHAMISLTSRDKLKVIAETLDAERREGIIRGPLHGIPIIIKDNISTHPDLGMATTCGALVFEDMRPSSNARVVDLILKAGLIIIGKSNLSELSYARGYTIPSGWSEVGGQCQSAYVRGGLDPEDSIDGHSSPSGSSAGSAVGVSAGYSPVSIGTETDGSLMYPAGRAALYSIKPTIGLVSQDGIIPISHIMDSAGPMAKTPNDLALLLDVMREPSITPQQTFVGAINGSWASLSIAAVNYETWWLGDDVIKPVESVTMQIHKEIRAAYDKIKKTAARFVEGVPLVLPTEYNLDGRDSQSTVMMANFKTDLERFLKSVDYCKAYTLQEIIDFNTEHHVDLKPPYDDQNFLIDALDLNLSVDEYNKYLQHTREVARTRGLDHIFSEYEVDVIIGPCDSDLPSLASGSGYPIASVPLGYAHFNGRPFGLVVLAAEDQEAKLFNFMGAWEATFGPRKPPPMLQ